MTLEKSMFDSRKVKPSESIAPARKFTKHEQSVKFKGNRKDADKHYKQMRFQCTSTLSYSYFHLLLLSATLSLSYSQSQLLLLWNYRMLSVKCVTGSKDLTATPKDKTITETKSFVSCKLTWIVLFFSCSSSLFVNMRSHRDWTMGRDAFFARSQPHPLKSLLV